MLIIVQFYSIQGFFIPSTYFEFFIHIDVERTVIMEDEVGCFIAVFSGHIGSHVLIIGLLHELLFSSLFSIHIQNTYSTYIFSFVHRVFLEVLLREIEHSVFIILIEFKTATNQKIIISLNFDPPIPAFYPSREKKN